MGHYILALSRNSWGIDPKVSKFWEYKNEGAMLLLLKSFSKNGLFMPANHSPP
jgi:hypothetical protein